MRIVFSDGLEAEVKLVESKVWVRVADDRQTPPNRKFRRDSQLRADDPVRLIAASLRLAQKCLGLPQTSSFLDLHDVER